MHFFTYSWAGIRNCIISSADARQCLIHTLKLSIPKDTSFTETIDFSTWCTVTFTKYSGFLFACMTSMEGIIDFIFFLFFFFQLVFKIVLYKFTFLLWCRKKKREVYRKSLLWHWISEEYGMYICRLYTVLYTVAVFLKKKKKRAYVKWKIIMEIKVNT